MGVSYEEDITHTPDIFPHVARRALGYGSCTLGPSAGYMYANPGARARTVREIQKTLNKNRENTHSWRKNGAERRRLRGLYKGGRTSEGSRTPSLSAGWVVSLWVLSLRVHRGQAPRARVSENGIDKYREICHKRTPYVVLTPYPH